MSESVLDFLQPRLDAYLEDLRALVGIDSGSFDREGVNAVNRWLEDRLGGLGLSVERRTQAEFGDDLVATLEGQGAGRILLLGHSDTVYPKGTAAQRPLALQGDRVLGPGVSDMKGGLLSGVYALAALRELGFRDFARITYLCVSDEEIERRHSLDLISELAGQADAALTLEAARADGDIVTARKGLQWYSVEAFGRMAHAGTEPEKGSNAILALARHILALDALNEVRPGATVNVGVFEGGSAPNIVPDYARARLDLRAFSDDDMRALVEAVAAQLKREVVPGVRTTMQREGDGHPAMPRTAQTEVLEGLAQQAARELGFEVKGTHTGGASDANLVASVGTPVLDGLGPVGGRDHSPEEYIERSSIVPRTALLAKLIMAIAQGEATKESGHGLKGGPEAPGG